MKPPHARPDPRYFPPEKSDPEDAFAKGLLVLAGCVAAGILAALVILWILG